MHAKLAKWQPFVEAIESQFDLLELRPQYSGRGMYGKTCLGVVIQGYKALTDLYFKLGWDFCERQVEDLEACETPSIVEIDNMGHDLIVYWRQVEVEHES